MGEQSQDTTYCHGHKRLLTMTSLFILDGRKDRTLSMEDNRRKVIIEEHISLFYIGLPYVRDSPVRAGVRLVSRFSKCPDLCQECDERNLVVIEFIREADVIPPVKENSLLSLFKSTVDERMVDSHPDPYSN
ncbi:hypothetical protein AVEN_60314-1 [Araneus ventricosus]|uniref:Uncharacterized protein n=1 Tax=Araneus ventricosus TaxID=182803 RepID=A0A4Y2GS22_ARAVE|nr:hypothetical protein AVEN_60314-1 [Araneus ventricosus]